MKVYNISYNTKEGQGIASVTAPNPNKAMEILKSMGSYNGTPNVYNIGRIVEAQSDVCGINMEVFTPYVIVQDIKE